MHSIVGDTEHLQIHAKNMLVPKSDRYVWLWPELGHDLSSKLDKKLKVQKAQLSFFLDLGH